MKTITNQRAFPDAGKASFIWHWKGQRHERRLYFIHSPDWDLLQNGASKWEPRFGVRFMVGFKNCVNSYESFFKIALWFLFFLEDDKVGTLDVLLSSAYCRSQRFLSKQLAQLRPELTMSIFSGELLRLLEPLKYL